MRKLYGFTLTSLIITISILCILAGIATPNLSGFLSKQEGRAALGIIHRNLSKARSHAIQRGEDMTVCGIDSNYECIKQGFRELAIFSDKNENGKIDPEEAITHISLLDYSANLNLRASFGRKFIRLKYTGFSEQAGSFIYCDSNNPHASQRVTVSMSGRSYLGRDTNNDGIIEMTNGKPISC